jgi:hypothetical protein
MAAQLVASQVVLSSTELVSACSIEPQPSMPMHIPKVSQRKCIIIFIETNHNIHVTGDNTHVRLPEPNLIYTMIQSFIYSFFLYIYIYIMAGCPMTKVSSKGPNRVGVFLPSPKDGKRSSFLNAVFSCI